MARRSRATAQALATSIRTPTPSQNLLSDEDSPSNRSRRYATPLAENNGVRDEEALSEDEGDREEDHGSPAIESDEPSRHSTPARGHSSIPRKRRAGRPPRTRALASSPIEEQESREAGSDTGTPRKRGGYRGRGFGGGRWGKPRGGPSHVTQVPLDKEGNMASVRDDEIELPTDPDGETKVDKNGVLTGNREYKVRVFTISGKGDRLYMLSTEPARCIGFRDSYLFFQKHRTLWKIILTEEAKRDLIERSLIPHSYKGRAIGVVTARSVFREFGSRIIVGGRKIIDDYQVATARARGDVEGELAVPDDKMPGEGDTYDKNRFVAWHGASSVYHSGAPSVPLPNGKIGEGKKRKVIVTGVNWMFEHAQEASRFNSSLASARRQVLHGQYDPHTNIMQYPKTMQPSHARWEEALQQPQDPPTILASHESQTATLANGLHRQINHQDNNGSMANSIFPQISPTFERNFMITDTYYTRPESSNLGIPGPDKNVFDIGSVGLASVPEDVYMELSADCRQAFDRVKKEEMEWKRSWAGESVDGARAKLRISYNV
ncbi:MAG: hypothetical protein Q9167_006642 [Letrouitia subvulpina]